MRSLAVLAAVFVVSATPVRAEGWTVADTYAAIDTHSALAGCIVGVETGHAYDPYAVGAQGELGVAQLHPRGRLQDFYDDGFTDPFSPYQAMDYLDNALAQGEGHYWTGYWYCI